MRFLVACVLVTLGFSGSALEAAEPTPLSVVQALMDAESETDLELAVSLFAEDAVIVNVTGAAVGGAALERFLETDMWVHDKFVLEDVSVERNRVAWSKSIDDPFYRNIGVAPVRFALLADVRNGKIESIVAHVPPADIQRIDLACRQRTSEPQIYGRPCSKFVELITAQAEVATIWAGRQRAKGAQEGSQEGAQEGSQE
jgi:SnoaL-like domain